MKYLDAFFAALTVVIITRRAMKNEGKLPESDLHAIITDYLPQLLKAFGVKVPDIDGYTVSNEEYTFAHAYSPPADYPDLDLDEFNVTE